MWLVATVPTILEGRLGETKEPQRNARRVECWGSYLTSIYAGLNIFGQQLSRRSALVNHFIDTFFTNPVIPILPFRRPLMGFAALYPSYEGHLHVRLPVLVSHRLTKLPLDDCTAVSG